MIRTSAFDKLYRILNPKNWEQWCKNIWVENASAWIERAGQDHFYRQTVVVPALLKLTEGKLFISLIDIGSGDGYTTDLFLSKLILQEKFLPSVSLIDQSLEQLQRAKCKKHLRNAQILDRNLVENDWSVDVRRMSPPRLLLSIFVLQEIPRVSSFFQTLAQSMDHEDLFAAIIVHPKYSEKLRKEGKIEAVAQGTERDDWEFAGKYPIGTGGGAIYLPHFQRSFEAYAQIAASFNFNMLGPAELQVLNNPKSREVFTSTIYGVDILHTHSSALLLFEK